MGSAELITVTWARPYWSGAERGGRDRPSCPISPQIPCCTLGSSPAFEKYEPADAMFFTQFPAGTDGDFQMSIWVGRAILPL